MNCWKPKSLKIRQSAAKPHTILVWKVQRLVGISSVRYNTTLAPDNLYGIIRVDDIVHSLTKVWGKVFKPSISDIVLVKLGELLES